MSIHVAQITLRGGKPQSLMGTNILSTIEKVIAYSYDMLDITLDRDILQQALLGDMTYVDNKTGITIDLFEVVNGADFEQPAGPVDDIYLYILMRNDMESLNPGKAVAQGTHAANQMVYEARQKNDPTLNGLLEEWEAETGKGFGTCIVLSVDNTEMKQLIDRAVLDGVHAAVTHDPSYPLRDGKTMHFLPIDTCGYIFGRKKSLRGHVSSLPLMA